MLCDNLLDASFDRFVQRFCPRFDPRAPAEHRSPLCRVAQFGGRLLEDVEPEPDDHQLVVRLRPIELAYRCFARAKEHNPEATLLINDFDLTDAYAEVIEQLLERGCPIDAIGLQTHQHVGYRGVDEVERVIGQFRVFGKPLHFTENTILSGHPVPSNIVDLNDYQIDEWPSTAEGEARQAQQVSEFYQCVYAHPEVEALIWWDLQDGGWLGAPSGLVREDMTPKPAYHALKQLIKRDWWYSQRSPKRNSDGSLSIYGPEGSYELSVGDRTVGFTLDRDSPRVEI